MCNDETMMVMDPVCGCDNSTSLSIRAIIVVVDHCQVVGIVVVANIDHSSVGSTADSILVR